MKYLVGVLLLSLSLHSCALFKNGGGTPFKIEDASMRQWHAGVAGGGTGTNYIFVLKVKGTPEFKVDTVWIGNRPFRPQLIPMEEEGYYKLAMSYNRRPKNIEDPQNEWIWHESPAVSDNPPEFDGTALIIYRVNGERKTLEYKKEFRVEEPLNYP